MTYLQGILAFIKTLPALIEIYKHLNLKAKDLTVDQYLWRFKREIKGKNRARIKAQILRDLL